TKPLETKTMIDHKNSEPLYIQIANDIRTKIASGKLRIGDQLASQKELASEYSVSQITIRKAFDELIQEGAIYSRVGKGSYVANKTTHVDFTKLRTVGFVLRDISSPFFSRILASAEQKLSSVGYNLLLSSTSGTEEKEESMIRHFLDIGVNGLIIAAMSREYVASPTIRKLHEDKFPYVVVSYMADEDISYVGVDHELGAFLATQHLIKLGYKKIGYINAVHGSKGSILGDLRRKGYSRALTKYGIEYEPAFQYTFELGEEWNDYQSGYEIGISFVVSAHRPEAVFVFDDLTALGFQKAVLENGLRIPNDVAIVGFDNIRRGRTAPVPLTTIHQPLEEIGAIAADIVLKKINGEKVEARRILDPSLIVRDSCGAKLRNMASAGNVAQVG
ncbi:MAG: GntR family transcriptional regulator, partial [Bacteroidota bacterium]